MVTEHTIHRDYCPPCRKHVEPVVPDALPNAKIGHRAVALSAWLHYGVCVSISQVRELLGGQFATHLSSGGLVAAWQRPDFSLERYPSRILRIDRRLRALAEAACADADASRLAKRLRKHTDELFTFLDYPDVTFDNNLAERIIRPAMILRKISQCNRSEKGAATQAVLMSIYRALKLRGQDPLATITSALRDYLTTGRLPPLPPPPVADG